MSAPIESCLQEIKQLTSSLDREYVKLGQLLATAEGEAAASAIKTLARSLHRLAEASRAARAACPTCRQADADVQFEAVNKYSGVWQMPECDTCRGLSRIIAAVERAVRDSTATRGG